MRTPPCLLCNLLAVAGALAACGSDAALPGINPSLVISSPTRNSSVNLSANKQIAIGFNTNYTIKMPGACINLDSCGHIRVLVDNSNCNLPNLPYNNLATSSPTFADLGRCAIPTGMHTLLLELRRDDGSPVNGLLGNPVAESVTITAQ